MPNPLVEPCSYLPLDVLNPKYYIDIVFTLVRWLMGAMYMLNYLGTLFLGPLFGNSERDLHPLIYLKLGIKVLIVFGFNRYVDYIKVTRVCEMFEARIRVITSRLIALDNV
jgi:hypothetical protein